MASEILQIICQYNKCSSSLEDGFERMGYDSFLQKVAQASESLKGIPELSVVAIRNKSSLMHMAQMIACFENGLHPMPIFEKSPKTEYLEQINALNIEHFLENNILTRSKSQSLRLELEPGIIYQTSGSTGKSKFVHQCEKNLLNNARTAASFQNIETSSKIFSPLTVSHTGGLNMQVLPALIKGSSIRFVDKSSPVVWRDLIDHSFTHCTLVPAHLQKVVDFIERFKIKKSKELLILSGSCPIPPHLVRKAFRIASRIIGVYGLTEIGPFASVMEYNEKIQSDESFFPLGDLSPGYSVDLSSEGEILMQGPGTGSYIFKRDYGFIAESCGSPWVKTGDIGCQEEGGLYLRGRKKREINLSGYKINPEEIESILLKHPCVEQCLVSSESHPVWNEIPKAHLVGKDIDLKEIKKFLKERISSLKIPRKWFIVDEIKTSSIDKTTGL